MQRIDNVLFSHGGLTTEFAKWLDEDLLDADIDDVVAAVNDASQDYLWNDESPLWLRPQNKTRQLRRIATFSNKQYFLNQAMDMPNYDESRFIYLGNDEGKYIVLPRGLREEILKKFDKAGFRYDIEDKRSENQCFI